MKKSITYSVITLLILGFCLPMKAQILPHSPMRETRAVWLTTFLGLDWPKTKARDEMGINAQKAELCAMLDKLEAAGINTVLFQTRIRGTVIYPSRIEPWDACLTGKEGRNPGYDPLQFAIDECHKRGMAFHAWVVAMKVGDKTYLDPSDTSVGAKLSAICCEIAARYDVDGISFDYLRYPEDPKTISDKKKHKANGRGLTYNDWRRDNVTRIVRKVYNDIKAVKPYLWVTSSPVGKYSDVAGQSAGGWNARNRVYQDIERWMNEGIHDGIFPMMYFKDNNFYPFALQWAEMAEASGKMATGAVCPGLGIYFMSPREKDWPLTDITRELEFMRKQGMGQCYFRAKFLTDNTKGLLDWLRLYHNRAKALPMPLGNCPPTLRDVPQADSVTVKYYDFDHATLRVHSGATPYYNVYTLIGGDTILVKAMCTEPEYSFSPRVLMSEKAEIGVKMMSRYGFEGKMTVLALKNWENLTAVTGKSVTFAAERRKLFNINLTNK